jgi:hypothetical protein
VAREPNSHEHAVRAILGAPGALVVAALLVLAGSCTAFDNVPPPFAKTPGDGGVDSGDASDAGPAFTAPGFLSLTEAAKLCSRLIACNGLGLSLTQDFRIPLNGAGYSYCVTQLATTFEPNRLGAGLVSTTLRKIVDLGDSSCQLSFNELEDQELPSGDALCAGPDAVTPPNGHCIDAKTMLWCESRGGVGTLTHCGKPSGGPTESCVTIDGGALCSPGGLCPAATCEGNTLKGYLETADGTRYCREVDCSAIGLRCVVDAFDNVGCASSDKATGTANNAGGFCEGDVYLARAYLYEGRIDCSALGARCISRRMLALCAFENAECSPFDPSVDRCKAGSDVVELCVGGRRTELDCASIGKRCLPDPRTDASGSLCR